MSTRESTLLWLKDLLEHLSDCRSDLEWAEDPETADRLTQTMVRELDLCRRLCERLRRQQSPQVPISV